MNENIKNTFERVLTIDLIQVIISNSSDKEACHKVKIKPILVKGNMVYQVSEFRGQKVLHKNLSKEEVLLQVESYTEGELRFRQMEITTKEKLITILISKKGKETIKERMLKAPVKEQNLEHNREKQYILPEGTPVPFLIDLGVMTKDGKIVKAKYDKYKQINRFLEFVEDILPSLPNKDKVTILDFGCGKSYLTFAMYYYLRELKEYNVQIIGLDLKEDVIEKCNRLAQEYGYTGLEFLRGDIASYEGVEQIDMVVTLHACDTATDYALYKAIRWNAKVILSVPCCQHELNKQMKDTPLEQLFQYGIIKERSAALITDGLRCNLLEQWGYKTQILEFIDMSHTPKNMLIRAVKGSTPYKIKHGKTVKKQENGMNYSELLQFFGVHPTLDQLLTEYKEELNKK